MASCAGWPGAMRHERAGHTLQASALVNEAYLRLIEVRQVSGAIAPISLPWPRASCGASWWTPRVRGYQEAQRRRAEEVPLDEAAAVAVSPSWISSRSTMP
jgi:hypothetical protein